MFTQRWTPAPGHTGLGAGTLSTRALLLDAGQALSDSGLSGPQAAWASWPQRPGTGGATQDPPLLPALSRGQWNSHYRLLGENEITCKTAL